MITTVEMGDVLFAAFQLLTIAAALVATYVKMTIKISKLESRVIVLEQSHSDISQLLQKLDRDLGDIKLLLARKQLDQ
jgi:hypothetical protein